MATTTSLTSTNQASYADSVEALRTSLSFLTSSVTTLDNGVSDFPRIINVLKTARHYELIPQTTLQAAESSLRSELSPAITTLLDRADTHIGRLDRRTESLKARADLQQGRLENAASRPRQTTTTAAKKKPACGGSGSAPDPRARALKLRREALQYSVERLELEVLQRERELRKRLDMT